MIRPTVIDFFCGAGGFSEGFRQQGFTIIKGYDKWRTAIDTFNFNFGKDTGVVLDILSLESEEYLDYIERVIPDTDVIIGSPPCVSFSTSNRSGKADKSMGVRLIEVFLKIVVIKKYKKGSILKAWFMENVAKSKDHTEGHYSFKDLGLEKWANRRRLKPSNTAIRLKGNTLVLNAADFGSPQQRLRAISGEVIKLGMMVEPVKVKSEDNYVTLGYIRSKLPPPNSKINNDSVTDPLYPNITIHQSELTDHFYDSGLYECVWLDSRYLKVNHPYMGRMSFPENENKPSRTITATNIGSSREALIYKSEYQRKGNGEFRIPTVREAATIMSFPITYQFIASEGSKWKLVGNAVCPSVSRALAALTRRYMDLPIFKAIKVVSESKTKGVPNLNTFSEKSFDLPPKRNKGARFRRHLFKDGNITVTLSNYDIMSVDKNTNKWLCSVQYGNGDGFYHYNYPNGYYKNIEGTIKVFEGGGRFLEIINNGFSEKIANAALLQHMYEEQRPINGYLGPFQLMEEVSRIINEIQLDDPMFEQSKFFKNKLTVPKKQLLALYALNKIATTANNKQS